MKKKFLASLLVMAMIFTCFICPMTVGAKTTVAVKSISLSKSSISLTVKGTYTLTATAHPSNSTTKTVTWSTSNKAIATVSSSGKVTAIKVGICTITANSNNSKKSTCKVTVDSANLKYQIGKNFDAGTYVIVADSNATGRFDVVSGTTGENVAADFFTNRTILTVCDGEYLTVENGTIYPWNDAPKSDITKVTSGMYYVDGEIPSGSYTLTPTTNGYQTSYYELTSDCTHSNSIDSFIDFEYVTAPTTITLTAGEFIEFTNATVTEGSSSSSSSNGSTTGSTGTTTSTTIMADSDFQTYLNTNYGSLTINGETIQFNWKVNPYAVSGDNEIVVSTLNNSQYSVWLDWCKNNDQATIKTFINNVNTTVQANYPNETYLGAVMLQDYFEDYPTGFDASDITWSSTNDDWLVTHISVGFYSTDGKTSTIDMKTD